MAVVADKVLVELVAKMDRFNADVAKSEGLFDKAMKNTERNARRAESAVGASAARMAAGVVKAFAIIGGVQTFRTLLDSATRIDNALKVAGLSGQELEAVYGKLRDSAQRNAAPLESLVTLYGRLTLVQKDLNVSQDQLINFSDKVALALRVAGTDAGAASGALLQLSQAMGSGTVRAEEFNSIQEGALPILQSVASGLKEAGGSVSKLRQLVMDGKVSSQAFFRAFEVGASTLEERVAGSVLTTDQAFTNLSTSLIDAMRDFSRGALAADTLADAIGDMADVVNGIDFEAFGAQVREVIGLLNGMLSAMEYVRNAGLNFGEWLGSDAIGDALMGGDATKEFVGGAIKLTNQRGIDRRVAQAFDGAVADTSGKLTEKAIKDAQLRREGGTDTTARLPKAEPTTLPLISINDFKPTGGKGDKKKGGGGSKKTEAERYDDLTKRIRENIDAMNAETEARRTLDPLVNDYGFTLEKAKIKQDLLSEAKKRGLEVDTELAASIEALSDEYARAYVEAEKLAEQQEKIRENAEQWMSLGKDVTKGFIDDLIAGKSAAEAFAGALAKIGDALINDVLEGIFSVGKAGGGGMLSGLFSWLGGLGKGYANGGYTGPGGKFQPAGTVHKGEVVWSQADVARVGGPAAADQIRRGLGGYADGGIVGRVPAAVHMPQMNRSIPSASGMTFNMQVQVNGSSDKELLQLVQTGVEEQMNAAVRMFSEQVLPTRVNSIIRDPNYIG